jgi:hypothetical protein
MLAYILASVVGFGSLGIYLTAFFFPEVHRKNDIIWSGVGMFYALVLAVFARKIEGGLLLGHIASVALFSWLLVQLFQLRRQLPVAIKSVAPPTPQSIKTNIPKQVQATQTQPTEVKNTEFQTAEVENQLVDAPKVETPQVETPQVETPKVETPQVETPKVETPQIKNQEVQKASIQDKVSGASKGMTGVFAALKGIFQTKKTPKPVIVRPPESMRKKVKDTPTPVDAGTAVVAAATVIQETTVEVATEIEAPTEAPTVIQEITFENTAVVEEILEEETTTLDKPQLYTSEETANVVDSENPQEIGEQITAQETTAQETTETPSTETPTVKPKTTPIPSNEDILLPDFPGEDNK